MARRRTPRIERPSTIASIVDGASPASRLFTIGNAGRRDLRGRPASRQTIFGHGEARALSAEL